MSPPTGGHRGHGVAGGVLAGLVGVGGGVLFVPGLALFLALTEIDSEATSLLAVVLSAGRRVAPAGYGNLRLRDGVTLAALSPLGVVVGVVAAHAVVERALQLSFAGCRC